MLTSYRTPARPQIPYSSRQRRHSPVDWGLGLTVCIGAICEISGVIVTASDRLLTFSHTTAETALKAVRIHQPNWLALIAGDDITLGVESVAVHARETLRSLGHLPTVGEVQAALHGAWRAVRRQRSEATTLSAFNLDLPTFVEHGRDYFGPDKFSELMFDMSERSKLRCELLVCGFDHNKKPALLVCDDDFGCRDFTRGGFVAIGSGHMEALASLSFHDYNTMGSIDYAIYRACAAKFMAEKAPGVGKATVVLCLNEDGKTRWIFKRHIDPIRKLWESDGQPRIPDDKKITDAIGPILSQQEWTDL